MKRPADASASFEAALGAFPDDRYVLRLYVAGGTPQSLRALLNLKALCAGPLAGRYDLEVIDVYQEPERAKVEQVLAVPTLIKASPAPYRRLIGDLSDRPRVLRGLNLLPGPDVDDAEETRPRRRR